MNHEKEKSMNLEKYQQLQKAYKKKYGHYWNHDITDPATQFREDCPACGSEDGSPNICVSYHSGDYSWFTGDGQNPHNAIGWYKHAYYRACLDAAQAVCELCGMTDGKYHPHTDDKKQTHYFINVNGVRQMTPCKAAKIFSMMES